jgi:hypothetical protein
MPLQLLGVVASGVEVASTSFESIATVTVGSGGSSTITFSSIVGTYSHLQLRCLARSNRDDGGDYIQVRVNSDTGSNYAYHRLTGDGSSVEAGASANASLIAVQRLSSDYFSSSIFSGYVIDFLDYANSNKYKTLRALAGFDSNGDGRIDFTSGLWQSTSAITSIELKTAAANSFKQYSHFALYGIKSA